MKGCLKTRAATARKTVAFGEEISEEVHLADVWDRTPTEPARKLSYIDLLELKEIQRSLPRAQQLPDPVSGKMPQYILDQVPIGLLPLLPASASSFSSSSSSSPPLSSSPPTSPALPPKPPRPPPSTSWVPAHMQHLVPKTTPPEPKKPTFSFLPLLEPSPCVCSRSPSPSPDDHHSDNSQDPPTPSLTNASLESSPLSRASSSSPEPAFLSLADTDFTFNDHDRGRIRHAFPDCTPKKLRPLSISPQRSDTSSDCNTMAHRHSHRRNVMILNGIEISLDDDDDDDGDNDESTSTSPDSSHRPIANPNSIPRPTAPSIPHLARCAMSLHPPMRYPYQYQHEKSRGYADVASPWAG